MASNLLKAASIYAGSLALVALIGAAVGVCPGWLGGAVFALMMFVAFAVWPRRVLGRAVYVQDSPDPKGLERFFFWKSQA